MAVHKATRSHSLAQPKRRQLPRRRPNHQREVLQATDPHQKTELFDTLRHLNRGFGIALAALDRLGGAKKDRLKHQNRLNKPGIFPHDCLHDYRYRTEALRALANRDLLRLFAGREDHDAERFERLRVQQE
jgi:hypothetical protein